MPSPKRLQVLIVDDEAPIREILAEVIRYAGYDVAGTAQNGSEAVERAAQLRPDVVILDLHMPLMNGADALRAILAAGSASRVLLISGGFNLQTLPIDLTQLRGVAFLPKPFDVSVIVDQLDRWSAEL